MDKEQEIVFAPDEPYCEDEDFELPEDYWETFPGPKPIGQVIGVGNG